MAVTIHRSNDNLVITVPSTVDPISVQQILDQLRFIDINNRSQATDENIKELSRSVNRAMSKDVLTKLQKLDDFKDLKL